MWQNLHLLLQTPVSNICIWKFYCQRKVRPVHSTSLCLISKNAKPNQILWSTYFHWKVTMLHSLFTALNQNCLIIFLHYVHMLYCVLCDHTSQYMHKHTQMYTHMYICCWSWVNVCTSSRPSFLSSFTVLWHTMWEFMRIMSCTCMHRKTQKFPLV